MLGLTDASTPGRSDHSPHPGCRTQDPMNKLNDSAVRSAPHADDL